MITSGYLVVTPRKVGSSYYPRKVADVRWIKTKPTLKAKEIAFEVDITLPDTLWDRPVPKMNITMPKDILYDMDAEVAVSLVAPEVAESLKLDVQTVTDGLTEMIRQKVEDEKK